MNTQKQIYSDISKLLFVLLYFLFVHISKAASIGNIDRNKQLSGKQSQNLATCPMEAGGGFCPVGNTCCLFHGDDKSGSGCIPNNVSKDKMGVCCSDNTTGCAHGYLCSSDNKCVRDYSIQPWNTDPFAEVLPRYELCSPPGGSLSTVYGLPVPTLQKPHNGQGQYMKDGVNFKTSRRERRRITQEENGKVSKAIYHSTNGDIVSTNSFPKIKMAFIIVHGAGRNADDYFCTATASSSLQNLYAMEEVIVISPRFASPKDDLHHLSNDLDESEILKWPYQVDGTWRYGASPITPSFASSLSSFDVMDEFVEVLANKTKFPLLERISVAGHSSGGQFVQRWSLTSSSFVWNDHDDDQRANHHHIDAIDTSSVSVPSDQTVTLHAIVANPSSYAYLDNRRYFDGKLQVPSFNMQQSCPTYNRWEWGLDIFTSSNATKSNNTLEIGSINDDGDPYPRLVPYVSQAIAHVNGTYNLAKRYINRNILYLSGSLDRCNLTRHLNQAQLLKMTTKPNEYWCDSHGLETTCVDELQGNNRFERSENYFNHLKEYFQIEENDMMFRHKRWIVNGVGHDPSLMFTSDVGMKAIFGG